MKNENTKRNIIVSIATILLASVSAQHPYLLQQVATAQMIRIVV